MLRHDLTTIKIRAIASQLHMHIATLQPYCVKMSLLVFHVPASFNNHIATPAISLTCPYYPSGGAFSKTFLSFIAGLSSAAVPRLLFCTFMQPIF
jgi:hypothetical protein